MSFAPAAKRDSSPGKREAPAAAPTPASDSPRYVQALMGPSCGGPAAVTDTPCGGAVADSSPRYVQASTGDPPTRPPDCPRCSIQRSRDGGGLAAPSPAAVHAATHDRSPGRPLATAVAGGLAGQSGVGAGLGDVRVHTDAHANVLARGLGARAFTRGSDIYFAHGRFQPETAEGRQLITHELTHVEQNARGGPVREGVSADTDASEREADAASRSPDAAHPVTTTGPSAALARAPDGDLSTRVAAFKRLVLTTAQHRLLDNRENLSKWRTYLEDKIPLDEFKRELVATETLQASERLGVYRETYFTTENPSMQSYMGSIAAGDACPSCHGLMRAQQDTRRTTTVAERLIEYGGDETGLEPLRQRVATNMYLGYPSQTQRVAAYFKQATADATTEAAPDAGGDGAMELARERAPLTIDQRSGLMKQMYKTVAKLKPILGVLGPDGFQVLPTLIGISERIDQTPEQIKAVRQSVIDAIETRRGQYLSLYYQIDRGDIEWMHFGPILQDLLPLADADVQAQVKDELATWERNQTIKAIFTLGVSLALLLLAIFPPTSPLGVAALAAFEVGWGYHLIQEGQAQWRLGSAYSNAIGATNVLTKEQAAAGTGMMFMSVLEVVGGVLTGAGGFARASSISKMPLSSFAPRAPTLIAGTRTLQFGEVTVTIEADGTMVATHAAYPDMLIIVRNGEAKLFQSMGPGGMRLIDTAPFPGGQVGPASLGPFDSTALVPYQQSSALVPYQPPGALVPYQPPGALVPYQPPGALVPYQLPGALVPYQFPGALVPYQSPGPLALYQPPGPLACYPQPGPSMSSPMSTALVPYQPPGALVPYQQPGPLVPYQQSLPWSPAPTPPVPFNPVYSLPLGPEGEGGVMLMTRGLRPSDFGLAPIADNPVLLRLWNESLRDVAASTRNAAKGGNPYQKYLTALERGDPVSQAMLADAFDAVNKNFLPRARAAGYDIATVHHWNWPKGQYPEQVVDPRNLVPIPEQALLQGGYHPTHYGIHQLTSSGTNVYVDPTGAIHVIPIENWTNPWLPPQ